MEILPQQKNVWLWRQSFKVISQQIFRARHAFMLGIGPKQHMSFGRYDHQVQYEGYWSRDIEDQLLGGLAMIG